jgi:hypothetical protein
VLSGRLSEVQVVDYNKKDIIKVMAREPYWPLGPFIVAVYGGEHGKPYTLRQICGTPIPRTLGTEFNDTEEPG